MTENSWLKVVGIAGTIIPVGGALIGLGIYVGNLTNQIEASRSEVQVLKGQVSQLQDILQKTQETAVSGVRGPKGEKGDPGDQGPRGERGPQGEMGPAGLTEAEVKQLVKQLVQQPIGSLPVSGGAAQTAQATSSASMSSNCTDIAAISEAETLQLSKGQEFCEADGRLIATVHDIYTTGTLIISRPGVGLARCDRNKKCALPWLSSASYVYERAGTDGNGRTALLRRSR